MLIDEKFKMLKVRMEDLECTVVNQSGNRGDEEQFKPEKSHSLPDRKNLEVDRGVALLRIWKTSITGQKKAKLTTEACRMKLFVGVRSA